MGVSQQRYSHLVANWKCILICLGVAMSNFQYGLDAGVVGGLQAMPGFLMVFGVKDPKSPTGWNIETQPQQLITSCMNIGTIIGVFMCPLWARFLGRRPAIWVASALSCVSAGIQLGATSIPLLAFGRIVLGVSNAWYIAFANILCAEAAPPHLRAFIGAFFGFWTNIGAILGSVIDNETNAYGPTRLAYQVPLATLFIAPVVLSVAVCFIPESPRWLLVMGRPREAERALERLRGNSLTPEFLKEEYEEMLRGIEEEKSLAKGVEFMDIFRGTDLRRTLLCIGTTVSHSASGVWLFIAYGTYFFQMAGLKDPFKASITVTSVTMAGTITGMYVMYKLLGRRSMMLIGTGVAVLGFLGAGIAYSISPGSLEAGQAIYGLLIIYSFFSNGWSQNLTWPLANELVSSRLRVMTFSLSTGINYFFSCKLRTTPPKKRSRNFTNHALIKG
jgi:MFS family permease